MYSLSHDPVAVTALLSPQLQCCRSYSSFFFRPNLTPRKLGPTFTVSCAFERPLCRRSVSISLLCLYSAVSMPQVSVAGGFDKYMKRKKLDPLDAYVPAIILTQLQIEDLGRILEVDKPEYAAYRNLLRSGPAASLRVNIRAVAQYAADAGYDKTAYDCVDQCLGEAANDATMDTVLTALEELDSLLLRASRNDRDTSIESMKSKIVIAINALNSLLQTVPSEVLNKGKAVADAYLTPEETVSADKLDPDLKQLESIL